MPSVGGRLDGFLGLLQRFQEIRHAEQNLVSQERALGLLRSHLAAGTINLVQVDEFQQNVEAERNALLDQRVRLENAADNFKTDALGLPPDLPIELDVSALKDVRLDSDTTLQIVDRAHELLQQMRTWVAEPSDAEDGQAIAERLVVLVHQAEARVAELLEQLAQMPALDHDADHDALLSPTRIEQDFVRIQQGLANIREAYQAADPDQPIATRLLSNWVANVAEMMDVVYLSETRLRLAEVQVRRVSLDSETAFQVALENRLDLMNARAALVDQWRQIRLQANELEADLDVFVSGDLGTHRDNPVSFRGPTGSLRLGLRFDGAFTRLLERNRFRESIIEYQRARRGFIQLRDSVHQNLRRLLREMQQLERSLEIQRLALAIAVRRVDVMLQTMNRPPLPAPPGGPTNQLSPTTSFNMLTAYSDLRAAKDNVINVWLSYEAARMLLARDLGIMTLDPDGQWSDPDFTEAFESTAETPEQLPPPLQLEEVEQALPPLPEP